MLTEVRKHYRVWRHQSLCAFQAYLTNRIDSVSYFVGKAIRFGFFLLLIYSFFNFTDELAGYGKYEVIFFFLSFNLVDISTQAFLRGVYNFKRDIRLGSFDFVIAKPINPLFTVLTRLTDILDLASLVPLVLFMVYVFLKMDVAWGLWGMVYYLFFFVLGFSIVIAIHILVACINLWTSEGDNAIWLYREFMTIGRFPPEIFSATMQTIFTFVLPVIVIVAFPVKALLGLLSLKTALFVVIYTIIFFVLSLKFWYISLRKYSSASS